MKNLEHNLDSDLDTKIDKLLGKSINENSNTFLIKDHNRWNSIRDQELLKLQSKLLSMGLESKFYKHSLSFNVEYYPIEIIYDAMEDLYGPSKLDSFSPPNRYYPDGPRLDIHMLLFSEGFTGIQYLTVSKYKEVSVIRFLIAL